MSFRDAFRRVQAALAVEETGIPNEATKAAFGKIWEDALQEYRQGAALPAAGPPAAPVPPTAPVSTAPWLVSGSNFPIVGRPFTPATVGGYLASFRFDQGFNPSGITVHHTAVPSLAQRPTGFVTQHMLNIRDGYIRERGFKSGPHFFVDEDQIWAFTPFNRRGVHAVSFNGTRVGIEMLGNYDSEDPWSGRGLAVLTTTRALILAIEKQLGLTHTAVNFHRDDPQTSKTCPGSKITKARFLSFLAEA